jgi:signal recognition particle GTPase
MQIKVLKDTKGAKDKLGIEAFDYQAGETYEIFDELAEVFISQNWGVEVKEQIKQEIIIEEKAIENLEEKALDNLENKAIENLENKSIKKKGKK